MPAIAIVGPESAGKTTLCQELVQRLPARWVPEYAREFLQFGRSSPSYDKTDLVAIAHAQASRQRVAVSSEQTVVLFDTDLVVIYVWWQFRFGAPPEWLTRLLGAQSVDHHLLLSPDLPWQDDPQRESAHELDAIFAAQRAVLGAQQLPYSVVSGRGKQRVRAAENALNACGVLGRPLE